MKHVILVKGDHTITAPAGNWNFWIFFLGPIYTLYRKDFSGTFWCLLFSGLYQLIGTNYYNFWFIKKKLKSGYVIKEVSSDLDRSEVEKKLKIKLV